MRLAYVAAGAAGMYCGSCIHDNTLARALIRKGMDVALVPTYTPIRTDEESVAEKRLFFGGINVYLEQKFPLFLFVLKLLLFPFFSLLSRACELLFSGFRVLLGSFFVSSFLLNRSKMR